MATSNGAIYEYWEEERKKQIQKELLNRMYGAFRTVVSYFNPNSAQEAYSNGISTPVGQELSEEEESDLEKKVSEMTDFSKDPKKLIESQKYLSKMLEDFYDNNLEDFESFVDENGLELRYPHSILVSDYENEEAVAYTDGQTMIGAGSDLKEKIEEMSKRTHLTPEEVEEMVIAHELMHMSQPKEYLHNPALAEVHNEAMLTKYFTEMAQNTSGEEQKKYQDLADVSYMRMGAQYQNTLNQCSAYGADKMLKDIVDDAKETYLKSPNPSVVSLDDYFIPNSYEQRGEKAVPGYSEEIPPAA